MPNHDYDPPWKPGDPPHFDGSKRAAASRSKRKVVLDADDDDDDDDQAQQQQRSSRKKSSWSGSRGLHSALDDFVHKCREACAKDVEKLKLQLESAQALAAKLEKEKEEITKQNAEQMFALDKHEAHKRDASLMISKLLSDLPRSQAARVREEAEPYAFQFECLMCQTTVGGARDGVAIADCCNPAHCVCKDCLPGYTRFETAMLTIKDSRAEAPSTYLRCPYNSDTGMSRVTCPGKWGRDELRDACDGVLHASREDDDGLTDMERIDHWIRDRVRRTEANEDRKRSELEKWNSEVISTLQDEMRHASWFPYDRDRNCVFECPQCQYGPVILNACADLRVHNEEVRNGDTARSENSCHRCGFFCRMARGTVDPETNLRRDDGWNIWSGVPHHSFLDAPPPRRATSPSYSPTSPVGSLHHEIFGHDSDSDGLPDLQ